ncbi:hypothetical protein YC2023_099423 [Brassica napus]
MLTALKALILYFRRIFFLNRFHSFMQAVDLPSCDTATTYRSNVSELRVNNIGPDLCLSENTNLTISELVSQRLSLPCRLVKDDPSDNVQVHLNQMDTRDKDKDACGTVWMVCRMRMHVRLRFFHNPS